MAQGELENVISKRWIPRQDRAVRICPDHGACDGTLRTVVAVADPNLYAR